MGLSREYFCPVLYTDPELVWVKWITKPMCPSPLLCLSKPWAMTHVYPIRLTDTPSNSLASRLPSPTKEKCSEAKD